MFAKAAIWMVIALVLFTVFKQFDTRQARGGDMPYSRYTVVRKLKMPVNWPA